MILSRDQILERRFRVEPVEVEGGEILVRACPVYVAERMMSLVNGEYGGNEFVFVNCVVDQSGNRLYKDEDAPLIARTLDAATINLVVSKAIGLARISPEVEERIKKNWKHLDGASSGGSPSVSAKVTPINSGTN